MALSKLNYNSLNLTPVAGKGIGFDSGADDLEASFSGGAMTFIKKLTASSSSTLSFVNGSSDVVLDSTYKEYIFICKNIHPSDDSENFAINFSADTGSNYNVTKTTTYFQAYHNENGSSTDLGYSTNKDLAQSTDFQYLSNSIGNDNDQSTAGILHLFNPSSTTFVKHFISRFNISNSSEYTVDNNVAGYCNTTSAVDAVQFKMNSGTIDAGTITLYGIN
jgi:hypothetical protein